MKTILTGLLLCLVIPAVSQNLRLNVYTGYVFDDQVDSYYDANNFYDGKIKGGFQWGGGLEYMAHPNAGLELIYLHQSTTAPTTYLSNGGIGGATAKTTVFDLNIDWLMLGGNRYVRKPGSKMEGYGGFMIGAVFAGLSNPNENYDANTTKFAWGFRLGGNIWASPKIAIKIQASIMSATQAAGGGFYFGTGGAGAGVSTYSSIYQFGLGGGLCFAMGTDKK